jgi:protein TIF31
MQNVERDGSSDSSVGGETETETVVLCGPVEAKGILGSDGRFYVLDLVRITPKDWTFYSNNTVKGSDSDGAVCKRSHGYTAVLRPELIQLYSMWSQNKQNKKKLEREQNDAKKDKKTLTSLDTSKQDDLNNGMSDLQPVLFNPNVFMKYRAGVDSELVASDESLAKDAAEYLQQVVIPAFVSDIRSGAICPPDGNALTQLMHSCGINMRYLGRLAKLCKTLDIVGGISKFVLELLEIEMIARSTKHIIAKIMKDNDGARSAPGYTLIRVLNGIFGGIPANDADSDSNFKPNKNKKSKNKESTDTEILSCGIDVWECVNTEIKDRFGYELSLWTHEQTDADVNRTCKPALLRRVCQRIGLRIVSRKYHFSSAAPFSIDDIYAVVPVVKHSLPDHPLLEAKQLLERGRLHLSRGSLASSYELLQEASSLLYQVAGGAHEDSALCSSSLATVLYHAGDINGAISQQQRALALYSQLCGMDYHDTAFAHANLALFLHSSNQTENAVLHLRRAIYLLELCGGPHFPEVSSLYSRMGMMFQEVGQINLALLSHREALRRGEFDRLQAANTLHHMALACSLAGGNREALQYEKKVYSLYKETFGDEDPRTIESAKFMAKFTERAVEGAKGRKEIDAVAAANAVAEELLKELERDEGVKSRKSKKGKSSRKKN